MTAKTLAGAGLATALAAGLMFWDFCYFPKSGPYWQYITDSAPAVLGFALLSVAGAGVVLVLRAAGWWTFGDPSEKQVPRMFPEMRLHPVIALQRHRRTRPISEFPNFGMIWGMLFLVFLFSFAVKPPPSHGLAVSLAMQDMAMHATNSPGRTIGIYIDGDGRFYVNGTRVPQPRLRDALQTALRREVFGTVYLEANPDSQFEETAYAIAVIQNLDARLIWITPKMREELNRAGGVASENASRLITPPNRCNSAVDRRPNRICLGPLLEWSYFGQRLPSMGFRPSHPKQLRLLTGVGDEHLKMIA